MKQLVRFEGENGPIFIDADTVQLVHQSGFEGDKTRIEQADGYVVVDETVDDVGERLNRALVDAGE